MKKHNINGLNVAEFGEGNSKTVIFIHAFPFCNRMWDKQTEAFQAKYRVITYDLRGFGYSESPDTVITIDSHVEDLFSLMNAMKIEKPVMCGLSMGGYIALRALEQGQTKFRAAILCDTRSEADNNNSKANRARQMKQIKSGDMAGFTEMFIKGALSEKNFAENAPLVEFLKTMIGWQKPINVAGALLTLAARTDSTEYLERIDLPTLALVGKEDRFTPPEYSKLIYGKIRNANMAIIPDAGHLSNMENPEEFNKAVGKFLADTLDGK